jgi:hypothetical protein
LPSQDAHVCIIWSHFNKFCYDCGHVLSHICPLPQVFGCDRDQVYE